MDRDEVIETIRRELHHKYVLTGTATLPVVDGWWESQYTKPESDQQLIERIADAVLALEARRDAR